MAKVEINTQLFKKSNNQIYQEFWNIYKKQNHISTITQWTKGHATNKLNILADEAVEQGHKCKMLFINETVIKSLVEHFLIYNGDYLNPNWKKQIHDTYQRNLLELKELNILRNLLSFHGIFF
jgi:hypothetical protein